MTTGERIKKIRQEKGLLQRELGEKIGVSQQMIGQWENGKSNPKIETIRKIADALNVPHYELLGFDGSIRVNQTSQRKKANEETEKLFIKQATGEKITKEESQKVFDYIEQIRESYDNLSKSIKNLTKTVDGYLNENPQMTRESIQEIRENLQTLTDMAHAMPGFFEISGNIDQ